MTRTVVKSGVTWSVRDEGGGREEWTRIAGADAVGEFRIAGRGSCGIVDRAAPSASRSTARPSARSTPTTRSRPLVVEVDRFSVAQVVRASGFDGLETGGPLLVVEDVGGYLVVDALGPSPDAERYAHRFFHDLDRAWDLEQRARELGLPGRLAGDWHTHCGDAKLAPSQIDLDAWAQCRKDTGRDWVGVIVTDPPAGPVRWAAWVTTSQGTKAATLHLPEEV